MSAPTWELFSRSHRGMRPRDVSDHTMPSLTPSDWNALFDAHETNLYGRVSRRVGGERALTEDLVQEAWLSAVRTWDEVPRDPVAWLLTCAMNRWRNQLRREEPVSCDLTEIDPAAPEVARRDANAARALQAALARIKPRHAALIEEHHLDGLSLAQIAEARGLSVRAVEGRLARGRKALARALRNSPTNRP